MARSMAQRLSVLVAGSASHHYGPSHLPFLAIGGVSSLMIIVFVGRLLHQYRALRMKIW
jgi:hypothetical protein